MSLGWRCESALMPKKSKPIDVGSGSMKGLKSLLAQKEEKMTEKNKGNDKELNRRVRPSSSSAQSNKKNVAKVEKESKSSARKEEEQERERKREAALLAKAKLYEQIQSGKGVDGLLQSHAATSGGGAFLVNFDEKKKRDLTTSNNEIDDYPQSKSARYDEHYSSSSSSSSSSSNIRTTIKINDDSVEICDSFGRSRIVPKGSQEHLQYDREKEAAKREIEIQRARDRIFHKGQNSGSGPGSGPVIDSRGILSHPMAGEGNRSGGDDTNQQWAWSRGEHHAGRLLFTYLQTSLIPTYT